MPQDNENAWKSDITKHQDNIESYLRAKYCYNIKDSDRTTEQYKDAVFIAIGLSTLLKQYSVMSNPLTDKVVPAGWEKNDTFAMADTAWQMMRLGSSKLVTQENFSKLPSSLKKTLPMLRVYESRHKMAFEYMAAHIAARCSSTNASASCDVFDVQLLPCQDGTVISGEELIAETLKERYKKTGTTLFGRR